MDVEPLVRLEMRPVSLAPLAAGLPRLSRLRIVDGPFTRHPWCLSQLAWLTSLSALEVRAGVQLGAVQAAHVQARARHALQPPTHLDDTAASPAAARPHAAPCPQVAWDAALWAPGQVAQEAAALQVRA